MHDSSGSSTIKIPIHISASGSGCATKRCGDHYVVAGPQRFVIPTDLIPGDIVYNMLAMEAHRVMEVEPARVKLLVGANRLVWVELEDLKACCRKVVE